MSDPGKRAGDPSPSDRPDGDRTGLNRSLKRRTDDTHATERSSPAPADSASVQREEGRAWPVIWAVVTIAGAVVVAWILFF